MHSICDLDEDRLKKIGANYPVARRTQEVEELFSSPDIDAVAVATPVGTHYKIAKRALLAGKHVLVEKPLTDSVETAEELLGLARVPQIAHGCSVAFPAPPWPSCAHDSDTQPDCDRSRY